MATSIARDALPAMVGSEVALSDWFDVGQDRIAAFAEATDDREWIHLDPGRCRRESPFGGPVVHGLLTLALLPAMLTSALEIAGMRVGINDGLNKVRFPNPLPSGSRVRSCWRLAGADQVAGGCQFTWDVTIEADGATKPVCAAEFLFRAYR